MVDFKFSNSIGAIQQRIRRLPKLVNDALDSQTKRDVENVIKEYKEGIKRNNFGLEKLSWLTVEQKEAEGKPRPRTPLYGEGESEKNSLINALAYRKIRNGYRLYRRKAMHHEANIPLNVLLSIHENGALINNGKTIIRIPPRPVVDKAISRMLKKRKKIDPAISKAINELIAQGRENEFKKIKGGQA